MSDIKFACPHCSQHIVCPGDYFDIAIDCPACNQSLVVPRATRNSAAGSGMVMVASPPFSKHAAPPSAPVKAWTEDEWAKHCADLAGPEKTPLWAGTLFCTLLVSFVLKALNASSAEIVLCVMLGGLLSGILLMQRKRQSGEYGLARGLGTVVALVLITPILALGILFVGCTACR